jgi:hypothetical protein
MARHYAKCLKFWNRPGRREGPDLGVVSPLLTDNPNA